ncbi:MAG TPA: STAS domain-containing protein [Micromonosporaceae bacterium]|jgi:anti-anti-sigma factor
MQFEIALVRDGHTLGLHLRGELDLIADSAVRAALIDALSDGAADTLIVDLDEVTFLDCTAIGALVFGRHLAEDHDRAYRIVNAHGMPLELLTLTGVLEQPAEA